MYREDRSVPLAVPSLRGNHIQSQSHIGLYLLVLSDSVTKAVHTLLKPQQRPLPRPMGLGSVTCHREPRRREAPKGIQRAFSEIRVKFDGTPTRSPPNRPQARCYIPHAIYCMPIYRTAIYRMPYQQHSTIRQARAANCH